KHIYTFSTKCFSCC
ncbi:hypothetical protein CP09DC78_0243B, partial [Chlamydia psittaci 09DC78]